MKNVKKIILLIAGPGVLAIEIVALFVHLFAERDTKPVMVALAVVFFVVFIPLYSYEYFKQEFSKPAEKKRVLFKRKNERLEWEGGNIKGKVPKKHPGPGRLFS